MTEPAEETAETPAEVEEKEETPVADDVTPPDVPADTGPPVVPVAPPKDFRKRGMFALWEVNE